MGDTRERGVEALNRDFSRYDQVEKQQTYRLSESQQGDEEFNRALDASMAGIYEASVT